VNELKKYKAEIDSELGDLKKLSHRQKIELADYEQRYKGIDITKMHSETELYKT